MRFTTCLTCSILATLVAVPSTRADDPSSGWKPLFNGKDLTGWYTFLQKHGKNSDPDRVIAIEDGMIRLYRDAADKSEVVMGYIGTEKEYGDYHLRVQFRWGKKTFRPRHEMKRDAGLYYHINGPDAVWPRSLQFQVQQTDVGDLIALYGFQLDTWIDPKTRGDNPPTFLDADKGGVERVLGGVATGKGSIAYQKRLPGAFEVDGWNTAEVIAKGDAITHILNGHVVNRGKNVRLNGAPVVRGRIALEIEAAELDFRNVEIRDLGAAR